MSEPGAVGVSSETPSPSPDVVTVSAAELKALRAFFNGVGDCFTDIWNCPCCGKDEDWWKDSNADYCTRDAVATIRAIDTAMARSLIPPQEK